jgi:phosphoglycerol transferase MdoB-like AlkP superfamily enzyme
MRFPTFYAAAGILCLLLVSTPNIQDLTLLGRLDAFSISFFSLALIFSPLMFSKNKIASFISVFLAGIFITYNLLSGLYFYFFLSYPLLDYWPVIQGTLNQLHFLTMILILSIAFFIIFFTSKGMHQLFKKTSRTKNALLSCTLFSIFIVGQLIYKELYTYSETYTMKDTSASAFFLRSSLDTNLFYQDIESKQKNKLNTIKNSIPKNGQLPLVFHHDSLKEMTGDTSQGKYTFPLPKKFPLYKIPNKKNNIQSNENVILILLEGVRSSELGLYGSKFSATPNLDIKSKAFSIFKNNYSTAPLTAKSEYAINCSALDYFSGSPISSRESEIKKTCIPKILKEIGYETYWIHGNEKEFYKREAFLTQLGIDNIIDKKVLAEEGFDSELGWGLPDEELFNYTIDKLSNLHHNFYAEILTISNHSPFSFDWGISIPAEITYSKNEYFNDYRQGIYYTDYALNIFLEKFFASTLAKNTHLIITGDHGAWAFDDDSLSQLTKDEQFFRVPLLIYSPNSEPKIIEGMTSHIDIAPTILDLLKIQTPNSFMGMPVYSDEKKLNSRTLYSFYDRIYSVRDSENTCVPLLACFGREACPKSTSSMKKGKNPSNMVCGTYAKTQNMLENSRPTHTISSASMNRRLLNYSQLSLSHQSEPNKIK